MVGGRPVGDGDADERRHDRRHDRAGVPHRPALRAVLFRSAARDGDPVADRRAVLHPRARVHGLRISRAPLRRAGPLARQLSLPGRPRARARRDAVGAGGRDVRDSRLDAAGHRARDLRADDSLHDDRRRAGGGLDRRQADVHRRRRHVGGGRRSCSTAFCSTSSFGQALAPGRRDRPAAGDRLQFQPDARPTRSGRG